MSIIIKHYPQKRMCKEFYDVIDFLKKHAAKGYNKNWHWARWEWLLGHLNLNEATLPSIGLFMDGEQIVGLVTHDMREPAYIILNPHYAHLKPKMVDYSLKEFIHNGVSSLFVDENDADLLAAVKDNGYSLTENSEYVLALDCSEKLSYDLEIQFTITDFYTDNNVDKYVEVIHKGFENEGKPSKGLKETDFPEKPHKNPNLTVFIVAPNGEYAAHCGTWYNTDTKTCYVEPVVTIPEFRKHGLGKAVVYESINRCIEMGANKAIVISNQKFYYQIGFEKYSVCSLWEKKV